MIKSVGKNYAPDTLALFIYEPKETQNDLEYEFRCDLIVLVFSFLI